MFWTFLAKSLVGPGAAQQYWVGVSAVVVESRGSELSILQVFSWEDISHGPSCQPIWLGLLGGVRDGNMVMGVAWRRCLPSPRTLMSFPPAR